MQLSSFPVYIIASLLLMVLFAEWLGKQKGFRILGPSLIVIICTALLANTGIIPASQSAPPVYAGIFSYIAPLAIFYLLLDVRLKDMKKAGLPMLAMFLLASASSIAGCLAGYYLLSPSAQLDKAFAIAGMYTGTYVGGSTNLNAIALQYKVNEDGSLFAATNAVDNILGTVWIMVTLVIPRILQKIFPRRLLIPGNSTQWKEEERIRQTLTAKADFDVFNLTALLLLGFGTMFLSDLISHYLPSIPSILILTTIALLLAQYKPLHRLKGSNVLGYFFVLVFLAVIGAYCDIYELAHKGEVALLLMGWVAILLLVHGLLLFGIGGMFKQDWDIIAVASNASIGGMVTAPVCASSIGRPDLQLPGLLAGTVGNAIGTYLGIAVAEWLR